MANTKQNNGESTKHIDWKLFAKTHKLYTMRYEEETTLLCHFILDNSASMYYPEIPRLDLDHLNKMGFAVLAIAALMNVLKHQRDAVGLSIYAITYNFYSPNKSSEGRCLGPKPFSCNKRPQFRKTRLL